MAKKTNRPSLKAVDGLLLKDFSWKDKSVLVTGGTGSFGRKFIDVMLAKHQPRKLIVFSRDELKQAEMRASGYDHDTLRYFIGDVRDADRVRRALHGVDIVVHAAALKQVPSCEYNPFEAIMTNIMGTRNIVDAAIDAGVSRVMVLSTDKAVNPVNLYGATKLCVEKVTVQSNSYAGQDGTRLSCVRYGNVVGSRGSVIPVFLNQRPSGVITITDPRMTRFWITLDQGVEFVVNSIEQMQGGEVFVPKIPSMNVRDLAVAVAPECRVNHVGIRAGEKLHEVLVGEDEARSTIELKTGFIIKPVHAWWSERQWPNAKPLPEGFSYASNTNPQWLTVEELMGLIEPVRSQVERKISMTA